MYDGLDQTSGGYRYDRRLVESLREAGDTVEVITLPRRSPAGAVLDAVDGGLRERLDRPFDVLIQDGLCYPSVWFHNYRLTAPARTVCLLHSVHTKSTSWPWRTLVGRVERAYLDTVDMVVCTSEHTAAWVHDTPQPSPTLVAHPGGRHESPVVSADYVTARANSDPFRVVFVGNLLPRKGVDVLLKAAAEASEGWEVVVVGRHDADPAYAERVTDRVASLGLRDRVSFTGPVPEDRLDELLTRAHVLAVPSRYEAFGMVYLEAMEFGVVPLGTTAGGASEVICHDRNGILVPADRPGRIAHEIDAVWRDRDRLADLAQGALRTAAEWPSWDETMARTRSFLTQQAPARGRSPGTPAPDGGSGAG